MAAPTGHKRLTKDSKRSVPDLGTANSLTEAVEFNGLQYEGRRNHRHERLLPRFLQGMGKAKSYFDRFGHPTHCIFRESINGALPKDVGTGFAVVQEWVFEETCQPFNPAWVGRHFADAIWAHMPLSAFHIESGLLISLSQGGDCHF